MRRPTWLLGWFRLVAGRRSPRRVRQEGRRRERAGHPVTVETIGTFGALILGIEIEQPRRRRPRGAEQRLGQIVLARVTVGETKTCGEAEQARRQRIAEP